jgi:ATP-binding cassette, subfamily A (ABC1), member 3
MTVMETMKMYAALRGIRPKLIKTACDSLIKLLDLTDHVEKMCYTLSGGNKRKLSVAIALIGSPNIVLLDEPTSGMDPKTRRSLWNCLNSIRNRGKSLILTTHSMDETEALCTNIGIMVNGELKCLGSLQHLKSRYGEGYTLMVKLSLKQDLNDRVKINNFITFVLESFENSVVKESRDGFINFHINDNSTSTLSKVFDKIENAKNSYSIEYYIVTQTKLEQIFLNFASRQIDPESRTLKSKRICC